MEVLVNPIEVRLREVTDELAYSWAAVTDDGRHLATITPWFKPKGPHGLDMKDELTGRVYSVTRDSALEFLEGLEPQDVIERLLNRINLTQQRRPKTD